MGMLFSLTLLYFFSAQKLAFAETVYSNPWTTCIGDASKCNQSNSGANSDLIKAGDAIVQAYKACGNNHTYQPQQPCFFNYLESNGYGKAFVEGPFANLMSGSYVDGCVQCSNYVYLSLMLSSGSVPNVASAISANAMLSYDTFTAGKDTYVKIGFGVTPQRGDIGVAGANSSSGYEHIEGAGHTLIVKSVEGNGKFIAYEANWGDPGPTCLASDNNQHIKDLYTFYRKQ